MLATLFALCFLAQAPAKESPKPVATPSGVDLDSAALEYLAAWSKVNQRVLGMTKEHAAEFRKSYHSLQVRRIAKKYGLTEKEIGAAIKGLERKRAEAARKEEETKAKSRAKADRAKNNVVGTLGKLDKGAWYTTSYFTFLEFSTLSHAKDSDGLKLMLDKGQMVAAKEPMAVRVLEVHDQSVLGKGRFLRVRFLDNGGEVTGYCWPEEVGPE
jgi:hypothetical protein